MTVHAAALEWTALRNAIEQLYRDGALILAVTGSQANQTTFAR